VLRVGESSQAGCPRRLLTFVLNDPGDRALDLVDDPDLPCSQPPLSDPTEELARVIGDSETFFAFHLGILDRPTIISTSPALFHNTVTSTMPTLQRDDDQDIELETTKKLDAQHDEFIDADADADAARAQQDDKDAGMWSEWQNLGILETFKTFRFTCLLCMMAAFSAATDGYQVRRLSFLTVTLFFFLSDLPVRSYSYLGLSSRLSHPTPSIRPSSLSSLSVPFINTTPASRIRSASTGTSSPTEGSYNSLGPSPPKMDPWRSLRQSCPAGTRAST
jgi:hypothetical protein